MMWAGNLIFFYLAKLAMFMHGWDPDLRGVHGIRSNGN